MALAPGETSETFIREVDENLRRDQAEAVFKRYGKLFIAAAVLLLLAVGGYLFWQNRQTEKAAANSETFSAILEDVGKRNTATAPQRLDALAADANGSMTGAARLTRAALALQNGDRQTAIAQYREIAANDDIPQTYRDSATIRLTQLEYDTLKPADVIARLQPLAVKDNAWFGTAGELTALAMIKSNRRQEAATLLTAIAGEKSVPETIRARAGELASGLSIPAAPAAR
ncbi:tetratricopeptide repeat protein [Sphingomonas astaxanthinifaciens]|uniref:Membrane protein n=1 Tax=Sphingomonas astaxanthinifaciens DSM 22298 TaxID=1123267 RepID=A0ABQ5Z5H6_9SPHN|nr:tetratricopeptide repeat protein [Sphingomonas astaxanthinifaciens]GLR47267.1 membrane protein [Sphingomonas astaxanthinifaciens DSM 22298]